MFRSDERRTWIPLSKVAEAAGIPERTLRRYAASGVIPGGRQRSGRNGAWEFRREALEKWWANR